MTHSESDAVGMSAFCIEINLNFVQLLVINELQLHSLIDFFNLKIKILLHDFWDFTGTGFWWIFWDYRGE